MLERRILSMTVCSWPGHPIFSRIFHINHEIKISSLIGLRPAHCRLVQFMLPRGGRWLPEMGRDPSSDEGGP